MQQFDRKKRLLNKTEFDHVFQQAIKIGMSEFTILYRPNDVGHARLGFALSKKMVPKAHDRNRLKRLLRETFRTKALPPIDIVVLGRPNTSQLINSKIIANLDKLWTKLAGIYGN